MPRLLRLSPSLPLSLALVVASARAQSIDASQHRTCAVSAEGRLYCWGRIQWGSWRSVPVDSGPIPPAPTATGDRVTQVATGWLHDCARFASGAVYCTGLNYEGELGRGRAATCGPSENDGRCGSTAHPEPVAGTRTFHSVVSGQSHSCALTSDGRAYCWGLRDISKVGSARTPAEDPPNCRRVRAGSDPRCAEEPFEIPVPNLLLTDATGG